MKRRNRKRWSKFELDYLEEYWGVYALVSLSIRLRRTKKAIVLKAQRINLGASTQADEYLTANQISNLLSKSSHTIIKWIKKSHLKAVKKILRYKREFYLVRHSDLCEWLKNNQDRFDSRKIKPFSLGCEPLWLKEKRQKDLIKEGVDDF